MDQFESYDEELSDLIADNARQANAAEAAMIKLVLSDNSLHAAAELSSDWFQTPSLRKIYRAVGEMLDDGRPADAVTVSELLESREPNIHWLAVVTETVWNASGVSENLEQYTHIIREAHTKRCARDVANNLLAAITKDAGAVDVAIRDLMELGSAEQRYEHDSTAVIKAAVEFTEQAFDKAQSGETVGIPTGLKDLDDRTGGLHDTDLIVIPARPSQGKTAFLLNLALNGGVPFGVISSEQAYDQMGVRMVSIEGLLSGNRIRKGTMREEDWPKLTAAVNLLRNKQFWINDDPIITIEGIRRQARKWAYTHGIKALYVDYIQRIAPIDRRAPMHEQVKETTQGLKSLAKELRIPVVALAQVNRECEKRHDKRPLMGDIADASIIEKEADSIWTLYRDEVYNPDTEDKGIAEIGICKNRHGPIGVIRCAWDGSVFKFRDLEFRHYEQNYAGGGR